MKNIFIYILVFICRLSIIREGDWGKRKELSKNDIEIIRDRRMGKENWNVIIYLTFPNIPSHFNKLIGPACSVDSVDLLIFKETLLEVIELVAFYWDLLFSRTYKIENKVI